MKKSNIIIFGLITTIIIYIISIFSGLKLQIPIKFLAETFETHTIMLILSVLAIYLFKKQGFLNFPNERFHFKNIWKPILIMIIGFIFIQIFVTLLLLPFGIKPTENNKMAETVTEYGTLRVFLFVVIYASIVEEILFRGFLQNVLLPLKSKAIKIFKLKISLPVILSGVIFGLGHLIVLTTGAEISFVIRIVFFTTTVGLIAGYFYEKHQNILYAIIVHSIANIPMLIATLI